MKPKNSPKNSFFCLLFFVTKKSNLSSLEASLCTRKHITYFKQSSIIIIIPSSTTTTTIIPLYYRNDDSRTHRPTENQNNTNNLIKTRSIAYERLRMPFRTTNGSRLAIYTPSFRSFPVALVGYDERCLFALQRWTRWWKQRQRQQQKRRR